MVTAASKAGAGRSSLANPAAAWLSLLVREARLAVLAVPCRTIDDLRAIHGYLVEPAFRRRCRLLVHTERELEDLTDEEFIDPDWRYAWTLERLRHLAQRQPCNRRLDEADEAEGVTCRERWRWWWSALLDRRPPRWPPVADAGPVRPLRLDAEQAAAVRAGEGVVQVIAPAGSGKTSVLIERVKELLHRGVEARRILCTSFNKEAKAEIQARLTREGVAGIEVRSFHGLGRSILLQERRLRPQLGAPDEALWRQLAAEVAAEMPDAVKLEPAAAQEAVSTFKLSRMIRPQEALTAAAASGDPRTRSAARLYALYEEVQRAADRFDFDDLIAAAVGLLQEDPQVRRRWQARFTHVLVDEYQDIEPAQALLVGLLAAPQDALFCVGDEDQCIYAWRRATVQRVVELDQVYPGLERYPLVRNYRCGVLITSVSRRLIEHNRRRFRKPLLPGAGVQGEIHLHPQPSRPAAAALVAAQIRGAAPEQTVVLARTGSLLQEVAQACAAPGADSGGPTVELGTIHGAKGREWDRVILYAVDQGQFPHALSLIDGDLADGLEDERRLFYVALTRARTRLDIVYTARQPSQFLHEAGLIAR
jgi:superfamily I DNA/RNA helicase